MPRQDVPYGGAICRLKERIAEIWDKLGEKLHSINGVEGDAAGNVEILSGDAAITISENQVGHYIEIGLDHGELPSAAVQSVNGQTGAVVLTADEIGSNGNSNVQDDLDNLDLTSYNNAQAIAQEVTDRQNADAALQGNINTVQASIPGAAATAVANDPTVAQLATDVPNKLDKITSGSTLKAYTHTGATQGETPVVDGTAANSIGLRDANGRMQAADPASGATDKTLVTANWVSQTGAGRPNNLLHDTGNEDINGIKNVLGRINGLSNVNNGRLYAYHGAGNYWRKKINILQDTSWCAMFLIKSVVIRGFNGPAIFVYQRRAGSSDFLEWIYKPAGVTMQIGIKDDGIYVYQNGSDGISIELLGEVASQTAAANIISISDDSVPEDTTFRVTI